MKRDGIDLICDISELSSLFEKHENLNDFLQTVAETIAKHMNTSACSIFIYDEVYQKLILQATRGLEENAIGRISLLPGEGIAGLAFQEQKVIREATGTNNPNFKYIPGIMEETYEAFLAVPIMKAESCIGVIVVQDIEEDYFDDNDARTLKAIANQLATIIENARLLMTLNNYYLTAPQVKEDISGLEYIKGESASNGIAFGNVLVFGSSHNDVVLADDFLTKSPGIGDFDEALLKTEKQLVELQKRLAEKLSDVASLIFSAHLLILKDSKFSGSMKEKIKAGDKPQNAIIEVVEYYIKLFQNHPNQRLKEKVHDIKDLGRRLLYNLFGYDNQNNNYDGKVIIAEEVLPSDILKMVAQKVEGLIMINCAVTSHISILIRSLGLPAILTNKRELLDIPSSSFIIIDANQGNAYINPAKAVIKEFQRLLENIRKMESEGASVRPETFTKDGIKITLQANINLLSDLDIANSMKAEGIGLYRSEFPFIVRNDFPSEEEQYQIYYKIISLIDNKDVIIRTLDIGGDKLLSFYPHINESNPFLGMRAIRFSLKNRDIFKQQIRAILRAGHEHCIKIMFPLIASVDDFLAAKEIVMECKASLARDNQPSCQSPLLGAMIELPSAVAVIEELAREADFFSIGSNDLVQYMLAVDRTNSHLSDLYQPHHPAVLRSLEKIVQTAVQNNIPVSLCGDISSDEKLLPYLIGIGLRRFSLEPRQLPRVQAIISKIDSQQAGLLAARILKMGRIKQTADELGIPAVDKE